MRMAVFAYDEVGEASLALLLDRHPEVVHLVVVDDARGPGIRDMLARRGFPAERILANADLYAHGTVARLRAADLDLIMLAWWPDIIREPLISLPRLGVLNMHPSLLPHCRGKNPNFWAIVEGRPFGVTIHFVDASVDGGDIVFQREIPIGWEDTGGTLQKKARDAMVELFADRLPDILAGRLSRVPQDKDLGSFHLRKQLDPASRIDLDGTYTGRELLNLLRARTYPPHPGCWFEDEGTVHEMRIEIRARSR